MFTEKSGQALSKWRGGKAMKINDNFKYALVKEII